MSLLTNLFGGSYDDLWKAVIRPNRDEYKEEDLGPDKFQINHKYFKRTDFSITNKRNLKLMCSFWEPFDEEREYVRLPCVVYLHGNSSSRCEALAEIKHLLPLNITVFAFDFSGCGQSQGDYISLGWYEREDVEAVIQYLRKTNKVSTIGLWGRSMGAVTAIMYGDRDPSIAGMVLDSAFASLKELIEELVKERVSLPNFILNQATKLVKSTIMKKAKFNLDDIEPKEYAVKCFIPALFCHAKNDTFVNEHHCKDLYDVYAGEKNVMYVEGNHNSSRPSYFKDSAANVISAVLFNLVNQDINDNKNNEQNIINNDINNHMNDFNNMNNDNEEYMLQQILELSLKESLQNKNKDNQIINNNIDNMNIINNNINLINDNSINDKKDKNEGEENNNIIKDKNDIIDSGSYPHDSKIDNANNNSIKGVDIDKISNNSKKGLFDVINPVSVQNHTKNEDFNLNEV